MKGKTILLTSLSTALFLILITFQTAYSDINTGLSQNSLVFFYDTPIEAAARGCCSWHGGVAYCGSDGYYYCSGRGRI